MKFALLCLCLGTVVSSFAQDNGTKRFKFNYVSLEMNGYGQRGGSLSSSFTNDLLAQNSQVAKNMSDIDTALNTGYPFYGFGFGFYRGGFGINSTSYTSLSVQFIDQKMKRFEGRLSLGIGTGSASIGNFSRYYEATGRYDTLVSNKTGEMTFVDTTYRRSFYLDAYTQLTGIQLGYELHTKNDKRFHLYAGANINLSFSSRISASAHEYVEFGTQDFSTNNSRYETYELKQSFFMGQLAVPLGVEMKLGMKDNFWQNISLRANVRGVATLSNSTYTGTNLHTSFGGGFGLLFRFP